MKTTQGGFRTLVGLAVAAAGMMTATASTDLFISYGTAYQRPLFVGGSFLWNGQGAYITGFSAQRTGGDPLPGNHANPFLTFCIDASYTLTQSGTWAPSSFPNPNDGSPDWQTDGIYRAASLYNHYVSGQNVVDAPNGNSGNYASMEAAALQLAIWEVLYEPSASGYDVTAGAGFRVGGTPNSLEALANAYLVSSWNQVDLNLTTTFWDAVNPGNNQDLIGPILPIPEPTTVLAGLAMLVGGAVGGLRRSGLLRRA